MQLKTRQVHLDFHTSERIPDIGEDFDPAVFAKTARDAHIHSMTVFARCCHGWLYYPSKQFPELIHPHLKNHNLMLEQVDALHAEGIRAPIYITVQWDRHQAETHPEWLIRRLHGYHGGTPFTEPGFCQSLCLNTGFRDFIMAQTKEVCEMLGDKLDGLFFDIVGIRPCWCASCRADMQSRGIDIADEQLVLEYAIQTVNRFREEMTAFVRQYSPDCTIFYNEGHVGPCTKSSADSYTHFELESLPSGGWGYLHFPVTARYARNLGLDCLGMTGKFHTQWGDFHSLKNQAALEFECFRMLSYGFACSIGDQLEPRGRLNPATYQLIGSVFEAIEEREPWARPSTPVVEAALLTSENPQTVNQLGDDLLGAAQMLEELALQFDIIDSTMEFEQYRLLIIPAMVNADDALHKRLDRYVENGGAIIACATGGLSNEPAFPSCYGVTYQGQNEHYPDFIVAQGCLCNGLIPDNEYVIYQQGTVTNAVNATPLLSARASYFPRKGNAFCSHIYTPSAKGETYPTAYQNGRVLYFAHPLFVQYRDNAPLWCKQLIDNAISHLLPDRLVRHNGPSTLSVQLLEQAQHNRYTLHMLSYIPVRKSAKIDIIEERTPAYEVTIELNLPKTPKKARLVPEGIVLPLNNNSVTIPKIDGYAILELQY